MNIIKHASALAFVSVLNVGAADKLTPVDYVNPLVGTLSKHSLSTG